MKKAVISNLTVYGFSHAAIDLVSAAILFSLLSSKDFFWLAVVYNLIAFGLQAPLGLLIDKLKIPKISAIIGCILALTAILILPYISIFSVIIVALGNALFHLGGGSISLNLLNKKATAPGIFIAPGAIGLLIGTLIGKSGNIHAVLLIILLLICLITIIKTKSPKIDYGLKSKKINYLELMIMLLLLVILVRSFIGLALVFPWKSNPSLLFVLVFSVALGKALGGFLSDKFGWIRISVSALVLSAPLLIFGISNPIIGIIAMFLFNITTAVTLTALSNSLPGRPAFAFGLTCLALIIGALPTMFIPGSLSGNSLAIILITLISALLLFFALRLRNKKY